MSAIRLQRVSKWFHRRNGEALHVLQDIDLEVPDRSVVALLGASGCGKSTLLNIVAGLVRPDRGQVLIDGKPSTEFKDWRRLTYMFQEDRLLPWRSALQNVAFGLEAAGVARAERTKRATEALAMVGLESFAQAYPHELSGGMRSRVALARSLVTRPSVLLMDEPFSKLDPSIRTQMHGELRRLATLMSTTVLFVTHDVEEAVVLADQVAVLQPRPGRVREVLAIDLPQPRDPAAAAVADEVRRLRGAPVTKLTAETPDMRVKPADDLIPDRAPAAVPPGLPGSRVIWQRAGLVMVLLLIWHVGSLGAPAFVLPSPARVAEAWAALVQSPSFFKDLGITFYRVFMGFAIAAVVGTLLGLLLGANKALGEFFEPILAVINTVSSAIWAIFALIWFGLSDWTTVFVVFMTAMPLILTNVWQGTRTVNHEFIELAHTFRMSRTQVLAKVYLPTILPHFFSGARLAFGFGWRVSLVAETLGASSGIGYRLRQAADLVQTDQVFAWTLTLVSMMVVIEFGVLKPLERHLFRWKKTVA